MQKHSRQREFCVIGIMPFPAIIKKCRRQLTPTHQTRARFHLSPVPTPPFSLAPIPLLTCWVYLSFASYPCVWLFGLLRISMPRGADRSKKCAVRNLLRHAGMRISANAVLARKQKTSPTITSTDVCARAGLFPCPPNMTGGDVTHFDMTAAAPNSDGSEESVSV